MGRNNASSNNLNAVPSSFAVEIDPSASGMIVRVAFAVEAVLTLSVALPLIFDPQAMLRKQYLSESALPTPQATSLAQWLGVFMLQVTIAMFLAIPNKSGAIEARQLVYQMVAVMEALWIPLIMWQAWVVGEEYSGMSPEKLIRLSAVPTLVLLLFRLWVLFVTPHWMGNYRVKKVD